MRKRERDRERERELELEKQNKVDHEDPQGNFRLILTDRRWIKKERTGSDRSFARRFMNEHAV